jgi:hypothetical protein
MPGIHEKSIVYPLEKAWLVIRYRLRLACGVVNRQGWLAFICAAVYNASVQVCRGQKKLRILALIT